MKRSRFRHKLYDIRGARPVDPAPDFKYEGCFPPNHRTVPTPQVTQRPPLVSTVWGRLKAWWNAQPIPDVPVRPVYRQYQNQGDQDPRPRA